MSDKVYWKMRNGELISVDDMDINHLRNVLKMIIRNSNKFQGKALSTKKEIKFRINGEIAQLFNETYIGDIEDEDFDPTE